MTFRQAQELGAHVRKGEKGELVVYANTITRTEVDEDTGEEVEHAIPFMKGYTVFNVEQIEGLAGALLPSSQSRSSIRCSASTTRKASSPQPAPTSATAATRPTTRSVRTASRCRPSRASAMPKATTRRWRTRPRTGPAQPSRLDRDFGRKRWGDEGYAQEELVAELGSAFLAADLGLELEPREDHAAYIESWLKVLKA